MRLHEILKENKETKSASSLLEHKIDEISEENSILTSQVMMHALLSRFMLTFTSKVKSYICAGENATLTVGHL